MDYKCFNNDTSKIDMIISEKTPFGSSTLFMTEVISFLDNEIYPECGVDFDYKGFHLKEGLYADIIDQRIQLMNQKSEIKIQNVKKTYRIKRTAYNPNCDEFVIETDKEYIAFLWSITE